MRAYQIGASNLPSGFNHSFQIISYKIQELSRDELSQAYFWFPKTRSEVVPRLGEHLKIKDSLPQAALVCTKEQANKEDEGSPSRMIIVDGNHRATLFLSTHQEPKTLRVVIFKVSSEEYDYYSDLLHSNYLSCMFGHIPLEELRKQHLEKCEASS